MVHQNVDPLYLLVNQFRDRKMIEDDSSETFLFGKMTRIRGNLMCFKHCLNKCAYFLGSGCGSVGRAVNSDYHRSAV